MKNRSGRGAEQAWNAGLLKLDYDYEDDDEDDFILDGVHGVPCPTASMQRGN